MKKLCFSSNPFFFFVPLYSQCIMCVCKRFPQHKHRKRLLLSFFSTRVCCQNKLSLPFFWIISLFSVLSLLFQCLFYFLCSFLKFFQKLQQHEEIVKNLKNKIQKFMSKRKLSSMKMSHTHTFNIVFSIFTLRNLPFLETKRKEKYIK